MGRIIRNIIPALKSQMPLKRFIKNFFVTRNAWGLFYKRSHINENGVLKIQFSEKSARKAALQMEKKHNVHFSAYKCLFCDGWHIGKNKDNKKANYDSKS